MVLLYFPCSLHGGVWRSVASDVSARVSDKHTWIVQNYRTVDLQVRPGEELMASGSIRLLNILGPTGCVLG